MSGIPKEGDAYKVLGILRTPAEEPNFQALVKFLEEVRAAGFAEAIERAAQVALDIECEEGAAFVCGDVSGVVKRSPYDAIRALAPAATTQEPK